MSISAENVKALNSMCAGSNKAALGTVISRLTDKISISSTLPDVADYEIGDIVIDNSIEGSPVLKAKIGALTFASASLSV